MPQVFISYSRKDLAFVRNLAVDLQAVGLEVWWDLSGIRGGDEWERKITEAIKQSQFMIVVLTPDAVESRWVRREYLKALERNLKIIPIQVGACETPLALQDIQGINVLDGKYPDCLPEIFQALDVPLRQKWDSKTNTSLISLGVANTQGGRIRRASVVTPPTSSPLVIGGIQFVKIPAGRFVMGSKDDNPLAFDEEKPQHTLELLDFWMAKFPLTNEQYVAFKGKGEQMVSGWNKKKNHPVVNVSWKDAMEYCRWFNVTYVDDLKKHALILNLPTEAQWEKVARGEYGNEWPWGNEFDPQSCNSIEGKQGGTTPVDAYPQGESPYGVADITGNVWEWTHTVFKAYPYQAVDGREDEKDSGSRVLRGGSFGDNRRLVRCACRRRDDPAARTYDLGFRVCVSPIS